MILSSARWIPLLIVVSMAGCQDKPTASGPAVDPDAEVKANLARLDPEDQRVAERQKYCPVMPQIRLGEMGPPFKVVLKGETFFVCCKTCVRQAPKEPETILAQLKEIREASAKEPGLRAPGDPPK
jgi:hypothetical protein